MLKISRSSRNKKNDKEKHKSVRSKDDGNTDMDVDVDSMGPMIEEELEDIDLCFRLESEWPAAQTSAPAEMIHALLLQGYE